MSHNSVKINEGNDVNVSGYIVNENNTDRFIQSVILDSIAMTLNDDMITINAIGEQGINEYDLSTATISSTFNSFNSGQLIDGDTGTKGFDTNGNAVDDYLKIEFNENVSVKEIQFYLSASGYDGTFKLQYSDDDSTYTDILTGITMSSSGYNSINIDKYVKPHKYYRLVLSGVSSSVHGDFTEMIVKYREYINVRNQNNIVIKCTTSSNSNDIDYSLIMYDNAYNMIGVSNIYDSVSVLSIKDENGEYICDTGLFENKLGVSYVSIYVNNISGVFHMTVSGT